MAPRSVQNPLFAAPVKITRARALRRAMTPAEHRLWQALRRKGMGLRARVQHVILGWIVDFYLPAARLVVEVDGDIHDLHPDDDARRDAALRGAGLSTLRVCNEAVLDDLPAVLDAIARAIAEGPLTALPRALSPTEGARA